MSSDTRKAVVTKLAKMELNAYLISDWWHQFDDIAAHATFQDRYGNVFDLGYSKKTTWEALYKSVLQYYRKHLYELARLFPEAQKNKKFDSTLELFREIEQKRKKTFFRGEKEDYDGKVKLLPQFLEMHNILMADLKTSYRPIITDQELLAQEVEIEKSLYAEETVAGSEIKPSVDSASIGKTQQAIASIDDGQKAVAKGAEKPFYILNATRDVKLLDDLFTEYVPHIAHIDDRRYEELYNIQTRLVKVLRGSGIESIEGGGDVLNSNNARLEDLKMLGKKEKVSYEQKLLLVNNWETTKAWYNQHKGQLFDLQVAKYQGA